MEKPGNPLVALLRCPESGQTLHQASAEEIAALASKGHAFPEGALVRKDGGRAFPIRGGFPVMLLEESVDLAP